MVDVCRYFQVYGITNVARNTPPYLSPCLSLFPSASCCMCRHTGIKEINITYDIRIVHSPDDPAAKMLVQRGTLSSHADIMAIHSVPPPPPSPPPSQIESRSLLRVWNSSSKNATFVCGNFDILDGRRSIARKLRLTLNANRISTVSQFGYRSTTNGYYDDVVN